MGTKKMSRTKVRRGKRLPVKRIGRDFELLIDWSAPIIQEEHYSIQVAPLLGPAVVAIKCQPNSHLMMFFPGGAIVMTLSGKLLVADKSHEEGKERVFDYPMHVLLHNEMKHVDIQTWANLLTDDEETVFLLFQPGEPFKFLAADQ